MSMVGSYTQGELFKFQQPAGKVMTRPCPFCGSERTKVKPVWKEYHFVACLDCRAGGPVRRDENEAIEAWNRRAK